MTAALTRKHSKSFAFASWLMFGARKRAAFALYAFCRRLDDLVDGENEGDGSVQAPTESASQLQGRLNLAREWVHAVTSTRTGPLPLGFPGELEEHLAFREAVHHFQIPEAPFQELITGMEMDLSISRYPNFEALRVYCHRVAGVVGLMMTPVLGFRDERCLPFAAELGIAMQLTNILRDVREDAMRGRVYLPADELARFGISEASLISGGVDEAWRRFARFQIARIRETFERGLQGVPDLTGFGSRRVVRVMAKVYGHIADVIEARDFDVFSSRARVPFPTKLRLAAEVMLTPNPPSRPLLSAGLRAS